MKSVNSSALALAVLMFFLLGIASDLLHDHLFLPHTSIQSNLEDCDMEPCRAYTSQGWAYLGNSLAIALLAVRGFVALLAYFVLEAQFRRNILLLLLIPAVFALIAVANLPYDAYRGLRITVFISCGFLAVGAWRLGMRIVPFPLALVAVIFNPLVEIQLSRNIWATINLFTSVLLFTLAIVSHKEGAYSPKSE